MAHVDATVDIDLVLVSRVDECFDQDFELSSCGWVELPISFQS